MLQVVVLVQQSTLLALSEHSVSIRFSGVVRLNNTEALIMIDEEALAELLRRAQPGDTRIDDVIMRIAL